MVRDDSLRRLHFRKQKCYEMLNIDMQVVSGNINPRFSVFPELISQSANRYAESFRSPGAIAVEFFQSFEDHPFFHLSDTDHRAGNNIGRTNRR